LKAGTDFDFFAHPSMGNSQYDGNVNGFYDNFSMYNDTPRSKADAVHGTKTRSRPGSVSRDLTRSKSAYVDPDLLRVFGPHVLHQLSSRGRVVVHREVVVEAVDVAVVLRVAHAR